MEITSSDAAKGGTNEQVCFVPLLFPSQLQIFQVEEPETKEVVPEENPVTNGKHDELGVNGDKTETVDKMEMPETETKQNGHSIPAKPTETKSKPADKPAEPQGIVQCTLHSLDLNIFYRAI